MIDHIKINGFKGFKTEKKIEFSNLTLLFGGNSCGKSSTIQALMLLKQTWENKKGKFDLLLNGKYANLGSIEDIQNKEGDGPIGLGISIKTNGESIRNEASVDADIYWEFVKDEKNINNISLDKINLKSDTAKYKFSRVDGKDYFINNDIQGEIVGMSVNKLTPVGLHYQYDKNFNKLIHDLLSELHKTVAKKKKVKLWNKENDYYKEIETINECFMEIGTNEKSDKGKKERELKSLEVSKNLIKLIEDIEEKLGVKSNMPLYYFFILYILDRLSDESILIEIYEKYKKRFNDLCNMESVLLDRKIDLIVRNPNVRTEMLDGYESFYNTNKTIDEIMPKISYLGPIRERPRSIYEYESDSNALYVGKNGQYLPGVLAYFSDYKIDTIYPNGEIVRDVKFIDALNKWMNYIGLSEKISATLSNVLSVKVRDGGIESNIINVGVGVSQVLPVIALGLLSEANDFIIFEQPELHLHPYAQSKLMDFFVSLVNSGKQVVIESHSEYFLHRLRYLVLDKKIKENELSILFYNKNFKGVTVKKAKIGANGEFVYPKGFKDTTNTLIKELLNKKIEV